MNAGGQIKVKFFGSGKVANISAKQ